MPDPLEPALGGRPRWSPRRWLVTWIQWPLLVPVAHGLHGVRIGLARGDVLVRVGLLHAVHERVALEGRDAPVVLVLVGQMHPVALLHDALKQVPVGVKRRVDVQRVSAPQAHYSRRCPECSPPTPCPPRRDGRAARVRTTARPPSPSWSNVDWRSAPADAPVRRRRGQLHRPDPRGPRRPRPHAGRLRPRPRRPVAELDPEHPAPGTRAPHGGARPARLRALPHAGRAASRSRATPRWWRPPATTSGSGAVALVGNSMGGFVGAELAIRFPQRVERLVLVSAAGITTSEPLPRAGAHARPRGHGGHGLHRRPPPRRWRGGRSPGTWRWRWWRGTRAGWRRTWPGRR